MENIIEENIKIVIDCIRDYENGNVDREEEVIDIIRGIYDYRKMARKGYIRTKLLIYYNHIVNLLTHPALTDDEEFQKLESLCHVDLDYYKEAAKKLEEYITLGLESGEFPDLEAAYLLSINLSTILTSVTEYLNEMVMMEKSFISEFSYTSGKNVIEQGKARKQTVSNLVNIITRSN